jgi:hypothetical protein
MSGPTSLMPRWHAELEAVGWTVERPQADLKLTPPRVSQVLAGLLAEDGR